MKKTIITALLVLGTGFAMAQTSPKKQDTLKAISLSPEKVNDLYVSLNQAQKAIIGANPKDKDQAAEFFVISATLERQIKFISDAYNTANPLKFSTK